MAGKAKSGSGCVTLFALPFIGLALFALVVGGRGLGLGEKNAWVAVVAGLVFGLFGTGLIILARYAARAERGRNKTTTDRPAALWAVRNDWAAGVVKSSDKKNLSLGWFLAIVFTAVSIPIVIQLPAIIRSRRDYFFCLFLHSPCTYYP